MTAASARQHTKWLPLLTHCKYTPTNCLYFHLRDALHQGIVDSASNSRGAGLSLLGLFVYRYRKSPGCFFSRASCFTCKHVSHLNAVCAHRYMQLQVVKRAGLCSYTYQIASSHGQLLMPETLGILTVVFVTCWKTWNRAISGFLSGSAAWKRVSEIQSTNETQNYISSLQAKPHCWASGTPFLHWTGPP